MRPGRWRESRLSDQVPLRDFPTLSSTSHFQRVTLNASATGREVTFWCYVLTSMAFNRLPTEMVCTIFEMVLALDRTHDHELTLEEINQHRKSLFNIRNVATAWNTLLLSSPRVWCAINISSSQWIVREVLDRAQQTPLCLYSRWVRTGAPFYCSRGSGSTLADRGDQIRTIRFVEEAAYIYMFAMLRIREGTPNLQTLDLTKVSAWHLTDDEPVSEQQDLALPNLRLLQLGIHVDDCVDVEGLPCIDLPSLENIHLEIEEPEHAVQIVLQFRLPNRCRRRLKIGQPIETPIPASELCRFFDRNGGDLGIPHKATLSTYRYSESDSRVVYAVSNGEVDLLPPLASSSDNAFEVFGEFIRGIQAHFGNPPVSVTLNDPFNLDVTVLVQLRASNVTNLHIKGTTSISSREILGVLGSNNPSRGLLR
ncbi:hypothetical protein FRB90_007474 [Tulasnella sp. 427]|nr:hypothetical protein FRB90_007474 [Tulasnella sp. 427]